MKVLENRVLNSSVGVARVSKVDIELTKLLAIPVGGRDISKALGVDDGDDGHLHAGIGKINTADAAFVFGGNTQVVLVRELLGVASWLQRGHLEGILLGDLLLFLLFRHQALFGFLLSRTHGLQFIRSCFLTLISF